MAYNAMAMKAGGKVLESHLKDYEPRDPLYEEYVDTKGKTKRRKRELPAGLSQRDQAILTKVKKRAHYLDKGFRILGMRFGWTAIIGLIPFAGDATDAFLNYYLVVRVARKAEIPSWLLQKMLSNNVVSIVIGAIPIVGDILLAHWKANSRNAFLLEEFLRVRAEETLKKPSKRIEDSNEIKPGAGLAPGEPMPVKKRSLFGSASGSRG